MTDLDPVEAPVETDAAPRKPAHDESWGTRILLGTATALTLWFFNTSALRYLTLSRDSYGIFWPRREWLFVHVVAGTLALVLGPVQFWPGLKQKYPMLHRVLGGLYVASAGAGGIAAYDLAFHTDFGWMFSVGMSSMATAWILSTGMATVAICRGMIPQHREWMIRSYVVTFGFVVSRLSTDILEISDVGSVSERFIFSSWICWSVPLLITDVAQASGARLRMIYNAANAASVAIPDEAGLARLRNE